MGLGPRERPEKRGDAGRSKKLVGPFGAVVLVYILEDPVYEGRWSHKGIGPTAPRGTGAGEAPGTTPGSAHSKPGVLESDRATRGSGIGPHQTVRKRARRLRGGSKHRPGSLPRASRRSSREDRGRLPGIGSIGGPGRGTLAGPRASPPSRGGGEPKGSPNDRRAPGRLGPDAELRPVEPANDPGPSGSEAGRCRLPDRPAGETLRGVPRYEKPLLERSVGRFDVGPLPLRSAAEPRNRTGLPATLSSAASPRPRPWNPPSPRGWTAAAWEATTTPAISTGSDREEVGVLPGPLPTRRKRSVRAVAPRKGSPRALRTVQTGPRDRDWGGGRRPGRRTYRPSSQPVPHATAMPAAATR